MFKIVQKICNDLIKEKKDAKADKKELELFEYSCYKTLKDQIKTYHPQRAEFETAYMTYRNIGINFVEMSFRNHSQKPSKKEKVKTKTDKAEKTL